MGWWGRLPSFTHGGGWKQGKLQGGRESGGGEPNEEISKLVHSHPSPTIRNSRRLAEHQSSCFLVKNVLSRGSLHILYMSLCHRSQFQERERAASKTLADRPIYAFLTWLSKQRRWPQTECLVLSLCLLLLLGLSYLGWSLCFILVAPSITLSLLVYVLVQFRYPLSQEIDRRSMAWLPEHSTSARESA